MTIRIIEQAQKRKELAGWIEDRTIPVINALAQLYLFPNCQYTNHWKKEVWSNFNRVKLIAGRNKVPSKESILKSGWEVNKWEVNNMKFDLNRRNIYDMVKSSNSATVT